MALDKEYFDSIHIDIVKKKYYNANKVEAVFEDIRNQAEALNEENKRMRDQLDTLNGTRFEIGNAILTAQTVYKELVDKANQRAKNIIAEAEQQRDEIINEAREQQEYAVQRVERCYSRIKEQHMAAIDSINAEWQEFLCGLYPEDEEQQLEAPAGGISQKDIESKVDAIARELFSGIE